MLQYKEILYNELNKVKQKTILLIQPPKIKHVLMIGQVEQLLTMVNGGGELPIYVHPNVHLLIPGADPGIFDTSGVKRCQAPNPSKN